MKIMIDKYNHVFLCVFHVLISGGLQFLHYSTQMHKMYMFHVRHNFMYVMIPSNRSNTVKNAAHCDDVLFCSNWSKLFIIIIVATLYTAPLLTVNVFKNGCVLIWSDLYKHFIVNSNHCQRKATAQVPLLYSFQKEKWLI